MRNTAIRKFLFFTNKGAGYSREVGQASQAKIDFHSKAQGALCVFGAENQGLLEKVHLGPNESKVVPNIQQHVQTQ